jgi:hypothetical protein
MHHAFRIDAQTKRMQEAKKVTIKMPISVTRMTFKFKWKRYRALVTY